jgi:hypothetical protein
VHESAPSRPASRRIGVVTPARDDAHTGKPHARCVGRSKSEGGAGAGLPAGPMLHAPPQNLSEGGVSATRSERARPSTHEAPWPRALLRAPVKT